MDAVGALSGKPTGTVRITATKHAVSSVVMPVLPKFLSSHPDIKLALSSMITWPTSSQIVSTRASASAISSKKI